MNQKTYMNAFPLNFILHTARVRPRVLRLFGQWLVIRRVSEELEFFFSRVSEVKQYICHREAHREANRPLSLNGHVESRGKKNMHSKPRSDANSV